MGLKRKMIGQTEVKHSGVGDAFHDLISQKPHLLATASPQKCQGFTLLEGELGKPGSKIFWNYTHDGKESVATQIIEDVDEVKQSITFKMVEGDLMELYKSFRMIYHVDTEGEDNLITWTLEYEKLKEDTSSGHTSQLLPSYDRRDRGSSSQKRLILYQATICLINISE